MASPPDRAPPSLLATAIGTAILALTVGYFLGRGASIGVFEKPAAAPPPPAAASDEEDESDDDVQDLGELKSFPDTGEECKLVLVVRNDLGMTKGKIAAQCSHATLACYKAMLRSDPSHPLLKRWERLGQAKVALKVDNEEGMLMLQAQAISLGLCAQVIHDAGRTQIASGSATVLGIGPAPKSKVNEVTGHLKLL